MRWYYCVLLIFILSIYTFFSLTRFYVSLKDSISNVFERVVTVDEFVVPSFALVIQASNLTDELLYFINNVHSIRKRIDIYVLLSSGSFSSSKDFLELSTAINARVTRCHPLLCDSLVFSVFAYEVTDFVSLLRWNDAPSVEAALNAIRLHIKPFTSTWFGVFDMSLIRSIVSCPSFTVKYMPFNPIERIQSFIPSNEESSPSDSIAVVMNVFKRNYFGNVLSTICKQSKTPSLLLLIQNEAHLINISSYIPSSCRAKNIPFYHIWNSNWNAYSFFRHYVPIPTEISFTVITDDDLFLEPKAFETGMRSVREHHCVVTEHGGKITNDPEGFSKWEDIRSSNGTSLLYADYASLPQFSLTEWRKLAYRNNPFYRRFGDILFVSLSFYKEGKIQPCILPKYSFCEVSKDNDGFSTLNSHRSSYADDYNSIAAKWKEMGYVPLINRV